MFSYVRGVLFIGGVLLAVGGPTVAVGAEGGLKGDGDFQRGAKSWASNCARCHNIREPADLRDDQWMTTAFHMRVRAGLTGQETRDILTFLVNSNAPTSTHSLGVPQVAQVVQDASGDPAGGLGGEAVYRRSCIACHGADGRGALPGVPDFTRADSRLGKSDAVLISNITNGLQSPGSPMAMPAKGGDAALNEGDIEAVLGYLRQTFGAK